MQPICHIDSSKRLTSEKQLMFRFLHTADIHLDSPLQGLGRYDNAPEEEMRGATQTALAKLVDVAIEEECAFVIIAGDLFDGTKKDIATAFFFSGQMARLKNSNIPVFIVYGNHDAETKLKTMKWPENVTILSNKKPETIIIEELGIAIHGQSFSKRNEQDNFAKKYPVPVEGKLNIGILHTALEGHPAHASYAPCTLQELINKGYQYWALGHIHQFSVRNENPHVIFPGNLQGRSVRETGEKGAVLVTVDDDKITVERRILDAVRWEQQEIDLTDVSTRKDMNANLEDVLSDISRNAEGRMVAVRLTFTGRTPLHSRLLRDEKDTGDEIRVMASGMGLDVWVEKILFKTEPTYSLAELAARDDAVGDLVGRMATADKDVELIEELKKDYAALLEKLPPAAKSNDSAILTKALEDEISVLLKEAGEFLVSQLAESDL